MTPARERVFRVLLRLLPADMRDRHGREMEQVLTDLLRAAAGPVARMGIRMSAITGLLHVAAREHLALAASDVRFALRLARRRRAASVTVLLTIALGVGATTAIFSVLNQAVFQAAPYPDAGRLIVVSASNRAKDLRGLPLPPAAFQAIDHAPAPFDGALAYTTDLVTVASAEGWDSISGSGEPIAVPSAAASTKFFDLLGARPVLGRSLGAADAAPGAPAVAIIGYDLWRQRFGSSETIVGRTLVADGQETTIVGVLPSGFTFPDHETELWTPLRADDAAWNPWSLQVIARLVPDATIGQTGGFLQSLSARLRLESRDETNAWEYHAESLADAIAGPVRRPLLLLLGAVVALMLIVAANVANLLIGQMLARRGELTVRAALGASPARIVRQVLTEQVAIAVAGGVLGIGLAVAAVPALTAMGPDELRRLQATRPILDARVLLFGLAVAIVSGIASTLAPVWRLLRVEAHGAVRGAVGETRSVSARTAARSALIAVEVALATVLLVGAGLFLRSFARVLAVDSGLSATGVTTLRVVLPQRQYAGSERSTAFVDALLPPLVNLPGVSRVGISSGLPTVSVSMMLNNVQTDLPASASSQQPTVAMDRVAGDYFEALGVPVLRGRAFVPADDARGEPVAIVNQAFARRFWLDAEPLGRRIRTSARAPWLTVVGVVGDVRQFGAERDVPLEIFQPFAQAPSTSLLVTIRSTPGVGLSMQAVTHAVLTLDPSLPITNVRTLDAVMGESTSGRRFQMTLLALFASIAVAIAAVGVHGVVAAMARHRGREMALRLALGAHRRQVVSLLVRAGLRPVAIGLALGLGIALALDSMIASLLFEIRPYDPVTFVGAAAVLVAVACAAVYPSVRRTARLDPARMLRES